MTYKKGDKIMKKIAAVLIIVAMLFTQAVVFSSNNSEAIPASVKVLAIGNSFSADSMQWLYNILTDMGVEEVILANLFIGGCTLETHAGNAKENADAYTYYKCAKDTDGTWQTIEGKKSILYGLEDENWDFISLQQASGQSGLPSSYEPYLTQLIDYVKAVRPNANLLWNMTWAYQADNTHGDYAKYGSSQNVMYRSIINAVHTNIINNNNFFAIIPCGTAVQNMRTSTFGDTLTRDGYHMDKIYGRYLLGAMWAKIITGGAELTNLTGVPEDSGNIDSVTLDIILESVENAYKTPFAVTNSIYKAMDDETDYANEIANSFVDVTEQGAYDTSSGIFTFHNGCVARNAVDVAYLPEAAASLEGRNCAYVDDRFYVPQLFLDYANGTKNYTPLTDGLFDVNIDVIKDTNDIWKGRIDLTNYLTAAKAEGKITFNSPLCIKGKEIEIASSPDSLTSSITFDIPVINTEDNYYNFAFDFVTGGKTYSYDIQKAISFASTANGITIDGVISDGEWNNAYALVIDKEAQATNLNDWAGKDDISAKTYIAWDNDRLYLGGTTIDNNFTTAEAINALWNGDSIQFGIYHDNENNHFVPGEAGRNFHEIGLASIDGAAGAYKSKTQTSDTKTGEITDAEVAVKNDGIKTVYEFSIKWSDLLGYNYTPKAGDVLGFSVLYNDNDGNGRRGWVEYGGGIGGTKNPNEFSQLYLMDNNIAPNEISVYVYGKKLAFDQPPVLVNDRTLVPLRAIFEELGAVVTWDDETETAMAVKDDTQITIKIGSNIMMVNDKEIAIDVPAQLINDRTLIPLHAIAEAFGNKADWVDETQTILIY